MSVEGRKCGSCDGVLRQSGPTDDIGETPFNCDKSGHPCHTRRADEIRAKTYRAFDRAQGVWQEFKNRAASSLQPEHSETQTNAEQA